MVKKKRSLNETATTILIDDETHAEAEMDNDFTDLRTNLAEIRKSAGVIGYILKDATTATIDLQDPAKTVEYAMLSSEAFDSYEELRELFDLGDVKNVLIKCKNIKLLCLALGDCIVSIFMEKTADQAEILRKVSFQPK
jgi:predicted regulator of Ras-like GTPase activity (Roadblock/LC7/MglB family)